MAPSHVGAGYVHSGRQHLWDSGFKALTFKATEGQPWRGYGKTVAAEQRTALDKLDRYLDNAEVDKVPRRPSRDPSAAPSAAPRARDGAFARLPHGAIALDGLSVRWPAPDKAGDDDADDGRADDGRCLLYTSPSPRD